MKEINVNESKSSIVFAIQEFGGEKPEEAIENSIKVQGLKNARQC